MRKSQRMHLNALFFLLFCCSLLLGQSPQHAMTVTSLGGNLPTNLFFFRNSAHPRAQPVFRTRQRGPGLAKPGYR
ncbi:hypothetical protein C8F04DRAFT_1137827 [Mycena alexandri]|uniref:Secreted protein n=1 Tax=Mycena alexandri TaxID=1745969 RepID=A0AAD6S8F3_9AGAR|nr:hypothetical protein C8F04DRAFT_1137827 [Mycena alexandri]